MSIQSVGSASSAYASQLYPIKRTAESTPDGSSEKTASASSKSSASSTTEQKSVSSSVKAAPAAGGGRGPVAVAKTSNSATSSSKASLNYDARDTNQDGVVSPQEAIQYALKHPDKETEDQSSVSASQMQAGLNAYQQTEQMNSTTSSMSFNL